MGRVLVAGGTGFVGARLVRRLLERGHEVHVLTRRPALVPAPALAVTIADWRPALVAAAVGRQHFDWIFNLAAYGVDPRYQDPLEARIVNIDVARGFVEIAGRVGGQALVHVGSVSEYAVWLQNRPIPEDAPLESVAVYGTTKAQASLAVHADATRAGIAAVIVRLFGTYGARERSDRLLPSLLRQLSAGQPVPLSSGEQIRAVLYVDDAAEGLIRLAEVAGRQPPEIVNLCRGIGTSVREFATTVADEIGAPQDLLRFGALPSLPHHASYLIGDVTRLVARTGWHPQTTLRQGIHDAIPEWWALDQAVRPSRA